MLRVENLVAMMATVALIACQADGLAPEASCTAACDAGTIGALDLTGPTDAAHLGCGTGPACAQTKTCINGTCQAPTVHCQTIADCPPADLCVNGFCIFGACSSDSECSKGESCTSGHCVGTPQRCVTSVDCTAGEVCISTICVPRTGCTVDSDCSNGYACLAQDCVFLGVCKTTADCPLNDVCVKGGVCVHTSGIACTMGQNGAKDCPMGQSCYTFCPNGPMSCNGGVCGPRPQCYPPGSFSQLACPMGQVCVEGICQGRNQPWVCHLNADCLADRNCIAGACVAACLTDQACGQGGQVCIFGICQPPVACSKNSDCPAREWCIAGVCRSTIQCLKDADCQKGQHCAAQQCI